MKTLPVDLMVPAVPPQPSAPVRTLVPLWEGTIVENDVQGLCILVPESTVPQAPIRLMDRRWASWVSWPILHIVRADSS